MVLLICCLLLACVFEFVNGFHDTANAVATVIYTNTLKPTIAVVWSGLCNFLGLVVGVYFIGIAVAMGIVNLLPVEILIDSNVNHGMAMIFALLLSAIIWNLGTWYYGLPASSSHSLIGSILGIGIAYSFLPESHGLSINFSKAKEIGMSLVLSPLVGFTLAIIIMYLFKRLIKNKEIYKEPVPGKTPPTWVRIILVSTCTLVSFFHGSNDGQKGVGLIMLILVALMPYKYALNEHADLNVTRHEITTIYTILNSPNRPGTSKEDQKKVESVVASYNRFSELLSQNTGIDKLNEKDRLSIRKEILVICKNAEALYECPNFSKGDILKLKSSIKEAKKITDFSPTWVTIIIALSLSLGTMIGWKRIAKTIGEKIGKQHMSYAQGASAEMVAAGTIGLSTGLGLPVSTTHVLSSGIAGSMVAKKGLKNLQPQTIKNIVLAWVLTLPVTIILSGGLFLLFRLIF